MRINLKGAVAGIIVFVVLGGLWFLFLYKASHQHQWILINIPNFLFLICLFGGGVIGFTGNKSSGLIAGIITFIFITLIFIFMTFFLATPLPIPIYIINQLGIIIAFSTVGFVSALIGQRLKISWSKWRNAT
ncbi:MAG: hypothetical protein P9M10_03645 [Candidatus Euphemobacter frigidus]|nr:hypothetical protein [Candidatus Euphemobacter frigidus]